MSALVVSTFANATDTKPRDLDVETVFKVIRTGGKKLKGQIQQIRNLFEIELALLGDHKKAKLAVDPLKKQLPGVTWSGTFTRRANEALIQHNGFLCADLDQLGVNLANVRAKLLPSPYLFALSLSPTGYGLKAVFRVPADPSKHLASFRAVEKHVLELTAVQIDQSGKDPARLCFLSYDPNIYVNENATEIEPLPEPEKPQRTSVGEINLSERQRIAEEFLGRIDWQNDTAGYFPCPGKHLHTTGDGARDCRIDLDNVPTVHCFHDHCRDILAAINRELRSRIAKAESRGTKANSRREAGRDDASNDLTPLFSVGAAEYPRPLEESAFYGLAGKIVRRIEPHTESDPAALLVQFLVAFGNAIGRTAHANADAARHHAKLFAVFVGETSKGRKGTAWQHVLRFLKHPDEGWAKNCIASGLSSGEGLIWAVRDPITEIKPVKQRGRHTGEHETILTDQGVADKRLLVVETEFANVLKVMTRDGNTLSPVIRSAWDSGNLRTLTKNSPARATDAHISIIGHITRPELRRLLTETESANGFGNRFMWFAVRRSKCLPEGGNSPALADLVTQLQEAIKFTSEVGEVKRSDAARQLWAKIYPALSEGKPGLLGAITARAEAQVLRLSMIYALLDCSKTVEVEHLRAALALWRFCEHSARWIFESGTGDKNADRIVAALKVEGATGMSKEQIRRDVFNGHISSFELDEALRVLYAEKLASCEHESTAGRTAERWFHTAERCEVSQVSPAEQEIAILSSLSSRPQASQIIRHNSSDGKAASDELDSLPAGILEL